MLSVALANLANNPPSPAPGPVYFRNAFDREGFNAPLDNITDIGLHRGSGQQGLGQLCQLAYDSVMTTMNMSLPDELKTFVDIQVSRGDCGSTSEYVRGLIRRAQDRDRLRSAVLAGASSAIAATADDYVDTLRERIQPT